MLTKIKGAFWFCVVGLVGILVVTQLHIFGGQAEPLRVHTPTKTAADRTSAVKFFAAWARDYPPTVITYWIGNQEVQLQQWQLPVQLGHWSLVVNYDRRLAYALTVDQGSSHAPATDCELVLLDGGFSDTDRVHGMGDAKCWINPAV